MELDDASEDSATAGEAATPDEIRAAIEDLSKENRAKLKKIATYCLYGSEFQDPMELINEAVIRTLKAAHGEKGRVWKRTVPFMAFLIMTIRGIANDSQESLFQTQTVHLEAMAAPGGSTEDILGLHGYSNACVLEQAIGLEETSERQDLAKKDAEIIDAFFTNDDDITWLIMGIKDEQLPTDIRELSGMGEKQYDTARRRFRRGLEKLFPSRRKT